MYALKHVVKRIVPAAFYRPILNWWQKPRPVRWGSVRRIMPISSVFGLDRGQPIDRYYIEDFLQRHSDDIRGRVLEIGDSDYTRKFGGDRVTRFDVLHAVSGNPQATIVGDLATGEGIPGNVFDCMILTQTFLFIYDVRAAVVNAYRALKTGGILLATFPGISQISRYDMDRWGDYWRFTDCSARRLFGDVFGLENVKVETFGNVLAACAFLHGLASHELKQKELDYHDPDYQLLITVRAVKSEVTS
jgi:SAM-dependent methyltransferase